MSHHIKKCKECKKIISQCRCMDCNKEILTDICEECRKTLPAPDSPIKKYNPFGIKNYLKN